MKTIILMSIQMACVMKLKASKFFCITLKHICGWATHVGKTELAYSSVVFLYN